MNNNTAIHYHFQFSNGILFNPGYSKQITFQSIPFFQLYESSTLKRLRYCIDSISEAEMPSKYQKIYNRFNPSPYKQNNYYREELIKLKFCIYNNQSFFIRCYRLRSKNFIKVEITFFAESMGRGKYLYIEKSIKNAEKVFNFLNKCGQPLSLFFHTDDYFLIGDFIKYVRENEFYLSLLVKENNPIVKKSLQKEFIGSLKSFHKDSQKIAESRLKTLKDQIKMYNLSKDALL